jgi:hypothetical protein
LCHVSHFLSICCLAMLYVSFIIFLFDFFCNRFFLSPLNYIKKFSSLFWFDCISYFWLFTLWALPVH